MNKSNLLKIFPTVAPSAIQKVDDDWRIVGKYCEVSYLGQGEWDLWLCDPENLEEGLPSRKLNAILEKLGEEATFTELEGEAYAKVQGTELISQNLDLLGIKKKRQLSDSERERRRQLIRQISTKTGQSQVVTENPGSLGGAHV